jgi:hypothetical protein
MLMRVDDLTRLTDVHEYRAHEQSANFDICSFTCIITAVFIALCLDWYFLFINFYKMQCVWILVKTQTKTCRSIFDRSTDFNHSGNTNIFIIEIVHCVRDANVRSVKVC